MTKIIISQDFNKQNEKLEIDMMAKIEDVFQIIRDKNLKNGSDSHYGNKKSEHRSNDTKKKSRVDDREKFQKVEKKFDRRSRSISPKRRFDNRSRRDNMQRDGYKYRKDDRYNNRFTQGGRKNRSRDRDNSDKKRRSNRRSDSSDDYKNKRKVKNENDFSLSPEVKD